MESSIAFWINPVILVGIGTMLWRSQTRRFDQSDKRFDRMDKRFDRIDKRFEHVDKRFDRTDRQNRELTREVVAYGKSIARIEGRHEVHPEPITPPQEGRRSHR